MAKTILVGNGINRLSENNVAWGDILKELNSTMAPGHVLEFEKIKPLSLLYEEILLSTTTTGNLLSETPLKKKVAALVEPLKPSPFHKRLMRARVRHVLTTNYDYCLERATGHAFAKQNADVETKYNLFRRQGYGSKFVWHIHGEAGVPNSITLGYDHYSGYIQKLRTYATAGRAGGKGSPFKAGELNFDTGLTEDVYSWLDVFFRDDVYIIGLGLDFTEIDIWWALTYKHRLNRAGYQTGKTRFYDWHSQPHNDYAKAKISLLKNLGVTVESKLCRSGFERAYDHFLANVFGV